MMPEDRPAQPRFRPDIEGLRAVAVSLVVLYHAGVPQLPGGYVGVDVFFVISGYLMTSLVLRERARDGRFSFSSFYARRIRRLLPAAVVVLLVTTAATQLLLPPLMRPPISDEAQAAAAYVPNLWFAHTGTDYLASDAPSLFQHYWSLGVEEQFYLLWPATLVIVVRLARGRRRVVAGVLVLVTGASLALCVVVTGINQPWAFFSLPTRAWELAAGGLVALGATRVDRLPAALRRALAWAGLAGVLAVALTFSATVPFPGWAAVAPVASAAALLAGGTAQGRYSAARVLSARPLQWLGRTSYSLYLWHWPVLVVTASAWGPTTAAERVGLVALSVLLAALTRRFVEDPVRHSVRLRAHRRRSYALGAAATAVAVTAATAIGVVPQLSTDEVVTALSPAAVDTGLPAPTVVPSNVTPALADVGHDEPVLYTDGCHADFSATTPAACTFGDRSATRDMALVGDSHAAQWFPVLDQVASSDGWRLTTYTKSACPALVTPIWLGSLDREYTECADYVQATLAQIRQQHPDLVVIANHSFDGGNRLMPGGSFPATWVSGLSAFIEQLPAGTRVLVLGDTPLWDQDPVLCLSAHLEDPASCARRTGDLVAADVTRGEARAVAGSSLAANYVDPVPWLCSDVCQALSGNVVVYRDSNHLTTTAAGLLVHRVSAAVGSAASMTR